MHMIKIAINSKKEAYEFLGLDPNKKYSEEEILKAHKKKIMQNHPDRFASTDKKTQDAANEATSRANRARDFATGQGAYDPNRATNQSRPVGNLNMKHVHDAVSRGFGYGSLLYGASLANGLNPDLKSKRKINRISRGAFVGNIAGVAGGLYGAHKGYFDHKGSSAVHHGSVLGGAGLGYLYDKRKEMKKSASVYFYDDNKISKNKYDSMRDLTPKESDIKFKKEQGVGDKIRLRSPKNNKEKLDRLTYMGVNAIGHGAGAAILPLSILNPEEKKIHRLSTLSAALGGGLMGAYVGHKRWQASKK